MNVFTVGNIVVVVGLFVWAYTATEPKSFRECHNLVDAGISGQALSYGDKLTKLGGFLYRAKPSDLVAGYAAQNTSANKVTGVFGMCDPKERKND